jgi:hypothetical protein
MRGFLEAHHRHYRERKNCSADIKTLYSLVGPELCNLFPKAVFYTRHRNVFKWADSMVSHMSRADLSGVQLRHGTAFAFKWMFRSHPLLLKPTPWAANDFLALLVNAWCVFEGDLMKMKENKCELIEKEMDFKQITFNRGQQRSDVYTDAQLERVVLHELSSSKLCKAVDLAPHLVMSPMKMVNNQSRDDGGGHVSAAERHEKKTFAPGE